MKKLLATILVVGATGMTVQPLIEQLLGKTYKVRVVVRSPSKLTPKILENPNITVIEAPILELTDEELAEHVKDCDAVVSCLGHTLDFKGMFGDPKKLCTEAARRLCNAIEKNTPSNPTKLILMNTVGVNNPDCDEKRAWFERAFLFLFSFAACCAST
jgi:nucleoside-diphosphate-sugar epimerase